MQNLSGEKAYNRKIARSAFADCSKKLPYKAFTGDSSDRTRFKKLQAVNRAYFAEKGKKQNTCQSS